MQHNSRALNRNDIFMQIVIKEQRAHKATITHGHMPNTIRLNKKRTNASRISVKFTIPIPIPIPLPILNPFSIFQQLCPESL